MAAAAAIKISGAGLPAATLLGSAIASNASVNCNFSKIKGPFRLAEAKQSLTLFFLKEEINSLIPGKIFAGVKLASKLRKILFFSLVISLNCSFETEIAKKFKIAFKESLRLTPLVCFSSSSGNSRLK